MDYVSLGGNCAIAHQFKSFGIRQNAYPFDFATSTISQVIDVITNDFEDFEKLQVVKYSDQHKINNVEESPGSLILKNKYQMKFAHEITNESDKDQLEKSFIRKKQRFMDLAKSSNDLTFIRLETSIYKKDYELKLLELVKLLANKFHSFKLIVIMHRNYQIPIEKNLEKMDEALMECSSDDIDIKYVYFDDFSPDWKYPNLDWSSIIFDD